MIDFGNIYLIAEDFEKSVEFYKTLFEKDVDAQNKTRYAIFSVNGLGLSILNGKFDIEHPDEVVHKGQYCDIYDNMQKIMDNPNTHKIVINLCTDDLQKEYDRICALGLGSEISRIRYINARMPYYYFSMLDPDGNIIEITGAYYSDIL